MNIGIFSRTFSGSMEEVFSAIKENGLQYCQYNLLVSGLETMPDVVDEIRLEETKKCAREHGITLDALSGTFNMIAPDLQEREDGIRRFEVLCQIAELLEIPMISLCTGSKNPKSKWMWHDDNLKEESWADLLTTTERILPFAQKHHVVLGVETEASNVVNTPQKTRKYLDTFQTEHLKVIMDGANLFLPEQVPQMQEVLEEAFFLLGKDIVSAHAKDLSVTKDVDFVAAGEGELDFVTYVKLLRQYNYTGTLTLHGLSAQQVPGSVQFLKDVLKNA